MWASGVAVDGSGNVYTTGNFSGTADFDPGAGVFNLTSGRSDILVSKLDSAGNFVWAKSVGGRNNVTFLVAHGNGVAVDGSGNVYTTGFFEGTADFDPENVTAGDTLVSAGGSDIFVSKLDSAGNFVWAKQMGGGDDDQGHGVAVDGSGNVYTTGHFRSTADFDPGTGVFDLMSSRPEAGPSLDLFVSKLDSAGNFVWARHMGGTGSDQGEDVAVDDRGNVYTTGVFHWTADFHPPGIFDLTRGDGEIFVSKLDSAGTFVWVRHMGGTSLDVGEDVAVDDRGNVYTTGLFYHTADFDPGTGVFNLTAPSCGRPSRTCTATPDIFVSKLDSAGNFVWARQMGGTGDDRGHGVAVDDRGNVYTTGVVDRFLGPFDIFVAKYKGQVQHRATSCDQRRWHRTRDPATNSQHRFAALDHQRIRAEFLHRHDSLPQPRQSRRTRHHPRRHLSDDERRSATDLCHHAGTDQRPGFGGQDVGTRQLYCRHQLRNGGGNQQHSVDDRIGQGGVSDASGTYQRRGDGHYRRSDTWLLPIPSAGQRRANRGAVSTPTQSP